jgi:hypothetical protein
MVKGGEMSNVDKLMSGSIDTHVHFIPDSLVGRRQDALRLAQSARESGMRAIVLKSREYITVAVALLAGKLVPEVSVFGSITLDNEVGGLNPTAVLAAARMGAKVVWMPTFTSVNSKAKMEGVFGIKLAGMGQSLLNSGGKLLSEVREILQIIKEYDMVLASGHISPKEIFALVGEAKTIGLSKIVITHPLQDQLMDEALTAEEIKQLAQDGAFIEHVFWGFMPIVSRADPKQVVESVKDCGAEHCIMSSDFGQDYNPPAPEGMRMFIATMLKNGLKENEIETMVKTNPAKLLGLT